MSNSTEATTTTGDPQTVAAELAVCPPTLGRRVAYRADVLVDEILTAVRKAVPTDHPCRPALEALPQPVPYMNPDTGLGQRQLVARALKDWLAPRLKGQADHDPACAQALATFETLNLGLGDESSIEAAEKWAADCARILPADQRALAFQVSLAANSLLRHDDEALVRAFADALIAARGHMGFLLVGEVCDIVHSLGFTDRVN